MTDPIITVVADEDHSVYGGSVAEKWINCPGYWRAVKDLPADPPNENTVSGSAQHTLIEVVAKTGKNPAEFIGKPWMGKIPTGFKGTYNEDNVERAMVWFNTITELPMGYDLEIEKKVKLTSISDELFGSGDLFAIDIPGKHLIVSDYKDGGGKIVDVATTPQPRFYAVGIDDALDLGIDHRWKVAYQIVQPKAPDPVTVYETTGRDVLEWRGIFRKAHRDSKAEDAPLVAGHWCHWCRNAKCIARAEARRLSVRKDFGGGISPTQLTPEQVANVLRIAPEVQSWLKDVEARALAEALAGSPPPGFKVVEGRKGHRAWTDQEAAEEYLRSKLGDAAYTRKLISPTEAEKKLGKDGYNGIRSFVTQPDGKPALAVEGSERDNYSKQAQARAEFAV